jgi:hypothetical protein
MKLLCAFRWAECPLGLRRLATTYIDQRAPHPAAVLLFDLFFDYCGTSLDDLRISYLQQNPTATKATVHRVRFLPADTLAGIDRSDDRSSDRSGASGNRMFTLLLAW